MSKATSSLVTINFLESLIIRTLYVVIPLYILYITGNAMDLAFAKAIEFIPNIILTVIIGSYVDKAKDKCKVIIVASALQTASLILLCASIYYETDVIAIYTFLFSFTIFTYAFFNTHIVLTKMLVDSSNIIEVNSKYSLFTTLSSLIAPLLTSFMVSKGSYTNVAILCVCFSVMMTAYCYVYLGKVKALTQKKEDSNNQNIGILYNIRNSFRIVYENKMLLHLTVFTMIINAYEVMAFTNHFTYLSETLRFNESEISILLFFFSVGSILAAKYGELIFKNIYLPTAIILTVITSGLCYALLPQVTNYYTVAVILSVEGFMTCINGILIWSHRQSVVSFEVIGGVAAITSSIYKLLMPFSLILGGTIAVNFDNSFVYYFSCSIAVISSIAYLSFFSRTKKSDYVKFN
ncbi:MFS transporter [Vibrio cholerae]|uniref:MFS transporter n=1 Tax=Vibrio cholerae TaxID=666 RepID=UPI0013B3F2CC|nr:MFS transporter [Vibrio cholerae]USN27092.1 MFS transporter [synthetic construct]EJL6308975.1 MFS transporter [Vibrio cholerae]EKF9287172.1 MFS transporter [Vibrio cholerae]EKF9288659.1 MFS transporter [Vibrio cholerae]ELA6196818.1 MFS transporter [Vibrio cholerae]